MGSDTPGGLDFGYVIDTRHFGAKPGGINAKRWHPCPMVAKVDAAPSGLSLTRNQRAFIEPGECPKSSIGETG